MRHSLGAAASLEDINQRCATDNTSVVDKDINSAQYGKGLFDCALNSISVSQLDVLDRNIGKVSGQGRQLIGVAVKHYNVGAFSY
ncbi:hypothetical protein TSA6c_02290 [Azospirillum sp. TSA6c]|nr:hypothetical protein TSA6c_02290 [Azospirillum sp. TSA6c]